MQPLLQWESNNCYVFLVCVCSLGYPAWSVHAHHLWPVWLYHIFAHHLMKSTIFGKTLLYVKHVF
jgi:hypothetical protein